jgi:hypothetical protein
VDITQIPGLEFLALQLFSEIGRNLSCWPTAANFVPWLALCPDKDISGAACCGAADAGLITERASCFGWPPTRSTAVPLRWEITCAE